MKTGNSRLIQIAVLAALGLAAALSLALPQLLRGDRKEQLLSLSVMLRDTDSSGWTVAREGMEQAADELGAELRFLTLTAAGDSEEQEALLLREIEDGAAALVAVPADPAALSAALDPWHARHVLRLFTDLARELGITIIMVTHAADMAAEAGFSLVRFMVASGPDGVFAEVRHTAGGD